MRNPFLITLALLAALVVPGLRAANFTTINPSPTEPNLLDILDAVYGAGNYTRVSDDQDQSWSVDVISATMVAQNTGADSQLGYCYVCDGSDDTFLGPVMSSDGIFSEPLLEGDTDIAVLTGQALRWFDDATGVSVVGRVFSDPLLNALQADHMVTFYLNENPNIYVLAFEDWLATSTPASDWDYNDFVVQVEVVPNPEPGTIFMMGAALLGIGGVMRRRKAGRPSN